MIYKFKLISDEVDGFVREYEVDSQATFLDFNKAILKSCNFPDDQMTSFYICDDDWERKIQITREDMGFGESDEDFYVMESTHLADLLEEEGENLQFVFDPYADRSFYMVLKEEIPARRIGEINLIRQKGEPPIQLQEMDFSLHEVNKTDNSLLSSEETGNCYDSDNSLDTEDIDLDGFEISNNDFE